jgi:hypothetical protein
MNQFIQYIIQYFQTADRRTLVIVSFFTAILVYINYQYGLDALIRKNNSLPVKLIAWYAVFLIAFAVPYIVWWIFTSSRVLKDKNFLLLLFLAPAIFALKISLDFSFFKTGNDSFNNYWNHIIYWLLLLCIIASILFIIWRLFEKEQSFYGLTVKGINWKPYWIMLLIMVPLIALASTQADFLAVYPKLQLITVNQQAPTAWWQKILFELAYGSDFITIELFFRGFLILGFIKWAGKDAILPMACFYCTIHFGKPMGECISSYFGGMILGIVVYHTRSIYGGLMVHLGIAWLMELGGYMGRLFQ